jgi:two-component system, NarL family, nitrate/nitrite response regulator NarL
MQTLSRETVDVEANALVTHDHPGLTVVLAIKNDLLRYGVDQMFRQIPGVATHRMISTLEDVIDPAGATGSQIVLVPLADIAATDCERLRAASLRGVRVILLFDGVQSRNIDLLTRFTCAGYLAIEDLSPEAIGEALARVQCGDIPMPSQLARTLLLLARQRLDLSGAMPRMTPREQQALVLLVEGLSNKQIGRSLKISDHGAKRLVANILAKLDCPNRTLAVARALREGLYEQCTGDKEAQAKR